MFRKFKRIPPMPVQPRLCIPSVLWYKRSNCVCVLDSCQARANGDNMEAATEKTHRVFRVIEMNNNLEEFRTYWEWLIGVKLHAYSRDVLCPPKCKAEETGYNCTTCKKQSMKCWSMRKCYPEEIELMQVMMIIACSSAFSILAGFVVCYFELRRAKLSATFASRSPLTQRRNPKGAHK